MLKNRFFEIKKSKMFVKLFVSNYKEVNRWICALLMDLLSTKSCTVEDTLFLVSVGQI